MGEFRFRKFSVVNERSAMKVNTDGVLLGALMTVSGSDRYVLDLGTGTGTVALMAAQRHSEIADREALIDDCHIMAIDIDQPSAEEAAANFRRSPWSSFLEAGNISLAGFAVLPFFKGRSLIRTSEELSNGCIEVVPEYFDHIFSNPPYFESELKSPDLRRREARHCESMSYREIVRFASDRLSESGRLSLILPAEVEVELCRYARMCGLFPYRIVRIRTVAAKPPRRIVAEFSRKRVYDPFVELLVMQEKGRYTDEYISLTSEYYLF